MMIIQDRFTASEEALKEKEDTGKDCEEQFEKAIEDLQHYRDELAELKQIANPEVRSKVASDLDYEQLIEQHIASVGAQFDQQNSFLQMDASVQTNATMCQGMVNFLNRRSEEKESNATKYTALDCDAMREVLQEEFTKSWEEITRLLQEGENLAQQQKELCYDEAKEVHNTKHASITQDIKDSTRSIQMAKDVISALQPLLDNARLEAEALAAHIQGLKSDCNVDTAVSDHLKTVRRLIQSLNECPGRNDFRLTVPEIV
jgi:flagellin-specific chaperone FliS